MRGGRGLGWELRKGILFWVCSLISSSERSQLKVEATNNGVGGCWGKGCPPVILALEKPREEVLSQPRLHSNLKTIKHQITHTHTLTGGGGWARDL